MEESQSCLDRDRLSVVVHSDKSYDALTIVAECSAPGKTSGVYYWKDRDFHLFNSIQSLCMILFSLFSLPQDFCLRLLPSFHSTIDRPTYILGFLFYRRQCHCCWAYHSGGYSREKTSKHQH